MKRLLMTLKRAGRKVRCWIGQHNYHGRRNLAEAAMCVHCGTIVPPVEWPSEMYHPAAQAPMPDEPFHPNSPAGIYNVTCVDTKGARHTLFAYFNPKVQQWTKDGEVIGFADRINPPGGPVSARVVSMVNHRLRWPAPTGKAQ